MSQDKSIKELIVVKQIILQCEAKMISQKEDTKMPKRTKEIRVYLTPEELDQLEMIILNLNREERSKTVRWLIKREFSRIKDDKKKELKEELEKNRKAEA